MCKKIAFLLFIITILASCGVGRSTVSTKKNVSIQDELIEYGLRFLGKPYRYAGKGPNTFDCSGYTSFVFKKFGYNLNSSSSEQDRQVASIHRKQDLNKGDLVFFEGRTHNGRVEHVGIVTDVKPNGEFEFIHASTASGVIISKSTEPYYDSRYLRGGRVIENNAVSKNTTIETQKSSPGKPTNSQTDIRSQKSSTIPEIIAQENILVPEPTEKSPAH